MGLIDKIFGRRTEPPNQTDALVERMGRQDEVLGQQRMMLGVLESQLHATSARLNEAEKWVTVLGVSSDADRELSDQDRELMRKRSIRVYYRTPEGKAIIRNLVNYICGAGVNWTCEDENEEVQGYVDEVLTLDQVALERRVPNIILRTLRDGEVFIHKIFDSKGRLAALRLFEPAEVVRIDTSPEDAEVPLRYGMAIQKEGAENAAANEAEKVYFIAADEIHHIKWDVDSDIQRGRPFMENILKRVGQYEDWLNNRVILNKNKSSIFLEKIVEGGPDRVSSVSAGVPSPSGANYSQNEYAVQAPPAGTVVTHSKSIEYKWVEPNINADDCKEDGRQIHLSIAAGAGLPEFLLTSDASNANYASTLVAESPFVKEIESFQQFFGFEFRRLLKHIIQKAVDGGTLPPMSTETKMVESARKRISVLRAIREASDDPTAAVDDEVKKVVQDEENYETVSVPTSTLVTFEWPSVVTRDLWTETQALDVHYKNKWVSKRTSQMKFGYDPEVEDEYVQEEEEKAPEPKLPPLPDLPDDVRDGEEKGDGEA
jgi:hypothetical protein